MKTLTATQMKLVSGGRHKQHEPMTQSDDHSNKPRANQRAVEVVNENSKVFCH